MLFKGPQMEMPNSSGEIRKPKTPEEMKALLEERKALALANTKKQTEKARQAEERARVSPEQKRERLDAALLRTAQELREAGFLIDDRCQVDMNGFKGVKGDAQVKRDMKYVYDRELAIARGAESAVNKNNKFYRPKADAEVLKWAGEEREKGAPTKFEELAVVIFNQLLSKDFFAVRTARYDDLAHSNQVGVDTLIIEKLTGNVVGAFDELVEGEVGPRERLHEKTERILEQNFRGGVQINYGFHVEEGGTIVKPAKLQTDVPVFHLTLGKGELEACLASLGTASEKESEEVLLKRFIISIGAQIDDLMARGASLKPNVKNRLNIFSRKLGEIELRLSA